MTEALGSVLAATPDSWTWAPLKYVADINPEVLSEDTDADFRFRYVDITSVGSNGNVGDLSELRFEDAPSRARRLVSAGDVIVSTVRTYLRAIARIPSTDYPLVCSTGFAAVRASRIRPSFLYWWTRSTPFVEEVVARSVGVGYPAISPADFGAIRTPMPSPAEQRAIADFLDRETARIDALLQQKRDLIRLCNLRSGAFLANAVLGRRSEFGDMAPTDSASLPELPRGWQSVRLRNVASEITVGVVVTPAAFYSEEGLPFIRGYNVRPGHVTAHDLAHISPEANSLHPKSVLKAGDVLVVRTGQAGAAAVVPEWAVGGNCVDVLIIRCGPMLKPKFVELVLNSEPAARQVETMSVGAIQSHFNVGALRNLVLPLPPLQDQDTLIRMVQEEQELMVRLVETTDRQIQLLGEHRQALITAAVTRGIDVSGEAA